MLENETHILQRLKEQQLLSEVALMLASTLDLLKLYRHTLDAVHALLNVEFTAIFSPDENQEWLFSQASSGRQGELTLSLPIGNSPAGQAFLQKETIAVSGEAARIPTYTVDTAYFLPMNANSRVMGILGVYGNRILSRLEVSLLEKLATHAAFAIQNANSHAEIEARSFELALIIDATEAVNTTLDLARILSLIGKNLLKALHTNWSEIVTSYESNQLRTLAVQREAYWLPEKTRMISLEKLPRLQEALNKNQAVRIDSAEYAEFLEGLPYTDFLPIELGGKVLGLLQLTNAESALASSLMQHVVHHIAACDWKRALGTLRQVLRDTNAARVRFWQWEDQHLKLILDEGGMNWTEEKACPTRDLTQFPTFEELLTRQNISEYALGKPNLPGDIAVFMEQENVPVLLVLPFIVQENRLGLVLVGDTLRTSPFNAREIALAHALVLQAANAIKNAQLYNALQLKIEELRQTQVKLVQTARLSAIGELAAAVAHQINNPLTTVLGDTELVLNYMTADDPNWESLQAVHRAGLRAHHVVKRLLGMARQKPEDDVVQLLDINTTIENTMDLVEGTFQRGKVEFVAELAKNLPPALGLPGQLEDVWLNLLINARDAVLSQEERRVGIRTHYLKDKNAVQVQVWDTGPGLGRVNADVLFDAFYTTKPPSKGTGLGLYICKNIVERCLGTITAASDEKGAVFTVTLPCERENL